MYHTKGLQENAQDMKSHYYEVLFPINVFNSIFRVLEAS